MWEDLNNDADFMGGVKWVSMDKGTSINTGSDKQTYYKLSMYGSEADAPWEMAQTYFVGGGMHGDLAMVEASLSVRAFMHLVNLGVPFPTDAWGQFVGYKTDHDPRQRATSIGPYTSREMCRALIRRVRALERRPGRGARARAGLLRGAAVCAQRGVGAAARRVVSAGERVRRRRRSGGRRARHRGPRCR